MPKVMGILNVTPDSFHDGGKFNSVQLALARVEEMMISGVDIVDIGGYSSRPGADPIDGVEERARILPCLRAIKKAYPDLIVSIDTFRASIARDAVNEGATIVNDISGGELDKLMFSTVAELKVPYILMHMRGTPQTMQKNTGYDNLLEEMFEYFKSKLRALAELGVHDVIIDPGFGFGKSLEDNYRLLHKMKSFALLDKPLLAGLSRKSMIQNLLGKGEEFSLKGTMALNLVALLEGASIIRVHDVSEGKEIVTLFQRLTEGS